MGNNFKKIKSNLSYPIYIGSGIFANLNKIFPTKDFYKVGLIIDRNVYKNWEFLINKTFSNDVPKLIIAEGESSKSINGLKRIWEFLFKNKFDRNSLLINIGGGVICDLGGFAASTFMRGINFINIPSTLLAQVDASIGGKTGINFNSIKNGIGNYKNPIGILIDTNFLSTLPKREFIAAFPEIIKHAIISDKILFEFLSSHSINDITETELLKIINRAIKVKFKIIKDDPFEKGKRKILNLGHTIGHAVESINFKYKTPLLHGEAVALGIIAECKMAHILGMISKKVFSKIENAIIKLKLPTNNKNLSVDQLLKYIQFDKKNINGKFMFSLPTEIGKVNYNQLVPEKIICESIKYICQ